MNSISPLKKVLKNAVILLSGNMGANIFGLLSIAMFTHSQGTVLFGYYVLFLTFIEIIDKVFNFQTWQAFIKFATDFQVKKEEHNVLMLLKYSFLIDLISLIVASLVALSLSGFAILFFDIPQEYYPLLLLMSLTILFKITEISTGVFRLYDRFTVQAKIAVYSSGIKLGLFSIISLTSPSFEIFIYATIFCQFITMMMKYFYAKEILNEHDISIKNILVEKINITLIKDLKIFSFIVYNNFDVGVRMVSRQLDTLILGAEIVGIYKIAKELANIIAKLTDPIYQAIYPEFAKMLAKGKNIEAREMAKKISRFTAGVGLIFYGLFILLGQWAIILVFGPDFVGAYNITLIYFLAILIAIVCLPLVPILHSKALAKEAFTNQIFATSGYLIVIYPLVSLYSAIGASLGYIIFYIIWMILTLITIKKNKVFI